MRRCCFAATEPSQMSSTFRQHSAALVVGSLWRVTHTPTRRCLPPLSIRESLPELLNRLLSIASELRTSGFGSARLRHFHPMLLIGGSTNFSRMAGRTILCLPWIVRSFHRLSAAPTLQFPSLSPTVFPLRSCFLSRIP
jgi:hypothetical protein